MENVIIMFYHAVNACPVHGVFYVKLQKTKDIWDVIFTMR